MQRTWCLWVLHDFVSFHTADSTFTFLFKLEVRTLTGEWRRKIKVGTSFFDITPSKIHVPNLSYKLQLVKWLTGTTGQVLETLTKNLALWTVVGICHRRRLWTLRWGIVNLCFRNVLHWCQFLSSYRKLANLHRDLKYYVLLNRVYNVLTWPVQKSVILKLNLSLLSSHKITN